MNELAVKFFLWLGRYSVPAIFFAVEVLAAVILIAVAVWLKQQGARIKKNSERKDGYNDVLAQGGLQVQILMKHKLYIPVFCTNNVEEILCMSKERFLNDPTYIKNIMEDSKYREFANVLKNWDGVTPIEYDFFNIKNNKWFRFTLTATKDGKFDYLAFRNVTKYVEKENELLKLARQAESESESKTAFLSNMSHDIRTPMNGILGMLALARSQIKTDTSALTYLDKAEDLSQFLLNIINDILDISRIEAGKLEIKENEFDLLEFADNLRNMFQKNIEAKGLKYSVDVIDCKHRYLVGDELKLTQIMANFLSNSYKFTEKGEIRVTIQEMMDTKDDVQLMMRVHDTGSGMSQDFLDKVFRPFEQEGRNENSKITGSGLGMAIADQFTRLMGGEIFVDSKIDIGTDFSVYITLKKASGEVEAKSKEVEEDDTKEYSYSGLRILLAEDNEINAEIAKSIFEMNNATVDLAVNGKEAVEKFVNSPSGKYDVILMDIQMPVMNGWQAIDKIRNSNSSDAQSVAIFALTADAYVESDDEMIGEQIDGYFLKPVDFDKMCKTIGRTLEKKKGKRV
ncbi:MAG: ATP-binding protein [Eubacteriales bacterium]|nr:ATP-binding protein [Eubacteriales bacterium]